MATESIIQDIVRGEGHSDLAEEDFGEQYAQARGGVRRRQLREEADAYLEQAERDRPERLEPGGTLKRTAPPSLSFDIGSDVIRGLVESPRMILGATRNAVQNTLVAMDSLGNWLNENVADLGVLDPETAPKLNLPEVGEPASTTGGLVRAATQFLVGFIPALRGMQAISGGKAASYGGQFLQAEAAAALTSALVFDPHEERLSNLIQEHTSLLAPVTDFLAAKEGDTEAEGRFKNALEGLLLAPLAEGFVRAVRAVRANRREKGVPEGKPLTEPDEALVKDLGDPNAETFIFRVDEGGMPVQEAVGEELAKAFLESGQLPFDLPFKMNWAKFSSSEKATEVLNDVAQLFKGQIDEARRGTISDEHLTELARRLDMKPEDLLRRQPGGTMSAEQIVAAKMIMDASTQHLLALGRKAANSTDVADAYAFYQMHGLHLGLQKQFQGAGSELGRALRALRIPTGSTEKQINEINEVLMAVGGPETVQRLARALQDVNDPAVVDEMVRRSFGKRVTDAIVEYWYFDLLSGPHTHMVNVSTSAINTVWQIPERFLAEQFSTLLGTPGVAHGEAKEMIFGLVTALPNAIRSSGRAFWRNEPSDIFGKPEPRVPAAISSENFPIGKPFRELFGDGAGSVVDAGVDALGKVVRTPTRAIMAEDEFFRVLGREMQGRALALRRATDEGLEGAAAASRIRELMQNPDEALLEGAQAFSRDLTFTTPLGQTGRGIQTAINRAPYLKAPLPFIRTPANLFKFAGKRTPLALLSSSIRRGIARGGPEGDLALARLSLGSFVSLAFADLALNGAVTGWGPTDRDLRRIWLQTNQPFSMKIGNEWYSYQRTDPFGMFLGAAASYAEVAADADFEELSELATALSVATAQSVTNKTWLVGISRALDAFTQPDRYGDRWVQQTLGTFLVPTGASQTARAMDPVMREVNTIADAIRARTPGYSKDLPAQRDLFGHKRLSEGGLGWRIASPIYRKEIKDSPIINWMLDNKVHPDYPARVREGVEMTPHQYSRFQELAGHATKDRLTGMGLEETLNALVRGTHPRSYQWQRATDGPQGGRATIIQSYINAFRQLAWLQLLKEDNELATRRRLTIRERADAFRRTIPDPRAGRAPR